MTALHIYHSLPASSYIPWLLIAGFQAAALGLIRLRDWVVSGYLLAELALTSVGIPASFLLPLAVFRQVFTWSSVLDEALVALLLVVGFERLRQRSRRKYRSFWVVALLALISFVAVLATCELPLAYLAGHPFQSLYTFTHLSQVWMTVFYALIPAYCFITGALPDRRLLLLLVGLGMYLAVHSGAVDYLILKQFSHSTIAASVSNVAYVSSLALWVASTRSEAQGLSTPSMHERLSSEFPL